MPDIYLSSKKLAIAAGGCLILVIMLIGLFICINNEQAPAKEPAMEYAGAGGDSWQPK